MKHPPWIILVLGLSLAFIAGMFHCSAPGWLPTRQSENDIRAMVREVVRPECLR